jgi:type IV secretory pathway VirB9-like protein
VVAKKELVDKNIPILADLDNEIKRLQLHLEDLKEYQTLAHEYKEERDYWVKIRDEQRVTYAQKAEEIEQDKVILIDKLRKEMLLQIRAVKIKMLNMNEDQLVGTTKLTVI